jgi:hypothetical protein
MAIRVTEKECYWERDTRSAAAVRKVTRKNKCGEKDKTIETNE